MSDLIYDVNTGCFAGTTPTVPQAPAVADEFVFEQEANMIERDLRFYVAMPPKSELSDELIDKAIAAYDALAGKGGD